MDLQRFFEVLWKHKWVMMVGVVIGLMLAILSLYKVGASIQPPSFSYWPRSRTIYQTSATVFLDDSGFALGRVKSSVGALNAIAQSYPGLVSSDLIKKRVEKKIGKVSDIVEAGVSEKTPMVSIIVTGINKIRVQKVAETTADELIKYIRTEQNKYKVPADNRIIVYRPGRASIPIPQQSRGAEIALLLFLAPVAMAGGAVFVMENLIANREKKPSEKKSK